MNNLYSLRPSNKKSMAWMTPAGVCGLLCFYLFLTMSCEKPPEHIISSNNYDSLHLAPFVEEDFPFLTTPIDLRDLGPAFPDGNLTSRGIVINLGNESYACFDTDLLRWSVAWTGDFISMAGMAQNSYDDYFNKKNKFPTVLGNPKIATGLYPGWRVDGARYDDPRVRRPPYDKNLWGPVPVSLGRWEGILLEDSNSLSIQYSIDHTSIREKPDAIKFDGETAFVRTLQIQAHDAPFYLNAAEVANGIETAEEDSWACIFQGVGKDSVTAVGIAGGSANWHFSDNRYLTLEFEASNEEINTSLLVWSGPSEKLPQFQKLVTSVQSKDVSYQRKENITRWDEKVYTREIKSPDTAAYVTDQLLLPVPNPWNRNIRIIDLDFFENGRGAVVSYDGDVWLVDGIGQEYMTWTRYASGLNEPMSLTILRDTIYVFDRMGITRFHDYNGDDEADFYENFFNIADQSMESREWPADLVVDPEGGFFIAKGGSLNAGPHIGEVTHKGFVRGSRYDGSVLHVSEDGRNMEVVATGLRGPYLGIHPETGFLTVTDQQGNSVPSTPVYQVRKGDFYGVPSTAHRLDTPAISSPLLWAPHNIEPSSIGQVWMTTDRMGPLNNQLIHISFGKPGLFRILIDTVGQTLQGGLIYIPAHYPTPVAKGSVRDNDGFPYFAGFNLWGSSSKGISSLLRLRYTGLPDKLPVGFEAGKEGVLLHFDQPLDSLSVANVGNFQVKRYNYLRTEEYGSGHYRLDGTPGEEMIPVLATHLSEDHKSVLLIVPNMTEVEQVEINFDINSTTEQKIKGTFAFTLHQVENLDLEKAGFSNVETGDLVLSSEELLARGEKSQTVSIELGEQLFTRMACIGCHSTGTRTDGLYGPPFQDLYGSVRKFNDGSEQLADEAYLTESILEPAKKVAKGYDAEMPSFVGILNETEIESIIVYIKSLSSHAPL